LENFIHKTQGRFGKYTKLLETREKLKDVKELDLGFVSNTNMFILYKNNG
jgi:hypothetical protein